MFKTWISSGPQRYDIWVNPDGQDRRHVVTAVAALLGLDIRLARKLVEAGSPIRQRVRYEEVRYLYARFLDWGLEIRVEPDFPEPLMTTVLPVRSLAGEARARGPWFWPIAWTPVFALNLIVPLVLSSAVTEEGGRIGMGSAIALYWAFGLASCALHAGLGRALVVGGLILAGTQFCPIVQFGAGIAALMICFQCAIASPEWAGYLMTSITGGLLLTMAWVIGSFVSWVETPRGPLGLEPAYETG